MSSSPAFAASERNAIPLYLLAPEALDAWTEEQDTTTRNWVRASAFKGNIGQTLLIPGSNGLPVAALAGFGTVQARRRGRYVLAAARAGLPAGTYRLVCDLPPETLHVEALGWLLAGYRFDRYRADDQGARAELVAPDGVDAARLEILAASETLTRDLINTPASDMGPDALEHAARALAAEFGADISVIAGDELLARNFPMIHAVGRASDAPPRLIELLWGTAGPCLTLVGKGVCFDTGGLNLKPAASMGLMKKDMGGAANVLGLARMVMALDLPLRLRVLIPAVENSVSGNAFRPQDILTSRKGLTVEINNTDAEGRLVLADALAYATEAPHDLVISMATLTGAARVALGPDLAPYYTDDDSASATLEHAARHWADPVWRMPFHAPYETMIEPGIADLDNAPGGGMAGSITAALFLRRFTADARYIHFDIYGWQPSDAPGRPRGGAMQGARALLAALPGLLGL